MSVSGFKINGVTEKYNYADLENIDVQTSHIHDGAVTTDKLADGAVTGGKLADGAVTADKIDSDYDASLAKVDGAYEQMTVGNAEQLVSTVFTEDKVPYNFRTTGGSADVGNREIDTIVGGTVAWNQLINHGSPNTFDNSRVSVNQTTKQFTITYPEGDSNASPVLKFNIPNYSPLHVYFTAFYLVDASSYVSMRMYFPGEDSAVRTEVSGRLAQGGAILKGGSLSYFQVSKLATTTNAQTLKFGVCVFDLTTMLGAIVADKLLELEGITEGAGIAKLKSWGFCDKGYYSYHAASLESVNVSSHKTVGFNAFDYTTGKAKVVRGSVYQITGAYTMLSLDGTSLLPDSDGYFTPTVSGELTVTGGDSTTTCVHLVWDGEKDGDFEDYSEHTYALDSDLTLRGIPKLDASDNLYYDGDIYESDGTVSRRYGIVDLGTLTWVKPTATSYMNFYSTGISSLVEHPSTTAEGREYIICSKYANLGATTTNDNYIYITTAGHIRIKDTSNAGLTDAQFKTLMSGEYLVYKLATPTTESADPYTNPQICDDFGTEEYVDAAYVNGNRDFIMPCGHDTQYQNNLRAKLEMTPNSPSGDGFYGVRHANGVNTYEPIVFPAPSFVILSNDVGNSWTTGNSVQAYIDEPSVQLSNALLATYVTVPGGKRVALYEVCRDSVVDYVLQSSIIDNEYYIKCEILVGVSEWQAEFTRVEV